MAKTSNKIIKRGGQFFNITCGKCGQNRDFASQKQLDFWLKLHKKVCDCSDMSTTLEMVDRHILTNETFGNKIVIDR